MSDSKRRIVVKVGTSTLTHAGGRTNIREMVLSMVTADNFIRRRAARGQ